MMATYIDHCGNELEPGDLLESAERGVESHLRFLGQVPRHGVTADGFEWVGYDGLPFEFFTPAEFKDSRWRRVARAA